MSIAELEVKEVELEGPSGLWSEAWRRLLRNPGAIVGFVLVALFVVTAVFAPLLAPYDPREQDLSLLSDGCCPGPSAEHPFGVDPLGRDQLSRVIYGARFSLVIAILAVSVGVSVGLVLGAFSGFFGGKIDTLIMRSADIMLSIPGLLMAIAIAAMLGPGLLSVSIAIGVVNIPIFARLLRGVPGAVLSVHGAVSGPCAEAMAAGMRRVAGADCALAVTGIAGPDGGTPTKPVGTVFVGVAVGAYVRAEHFHFAGDRAAIKWQSAQAALDLLRRRLLDAPELAR